jgi:LDH2 family malate/lactate/ureidoglycolate dehydrogenase
MNMNERIPYLELVTKVKSLLMAHGLGQERAEIEARIIVDSDLMGVASHGIARLPVLLDAIQEKRVNIKAREKTVHEFAAVCTVDCENGTGRAASMHCMQEAIARAKQFGIGLCLAVNTSHWGRAHSYVAEAAKQSCIGLCTTNAIPTMAAWGSKSKIFGNNPLGIGVPGIDLERPIVLDMAMSQASVGKIATYLQEGKECDQVLGLSADGTPSKDPEEILAGAVLAMGGYKGAGLAFMMEAMTSVLSSGLLNYELQDKDPSGIDPNASKIFIAINIESFTSLESYQSQVSRLIDRLRPLAPEFFYPGERGWKSKSENLDLGVPLKIDLLTKLKPYGLSL